MNARARSSLAKGFIHPIISENPVCDNFGLCTARITNAPDVSAGTGWQEKRIICELFDKDTRMFRGSGWWNGAIDRVFGGHPDGTIAMTRSAENVRLKNNRIVNGNDKMVLDHADVK